MGLLCIVTSWPSATSRPSRPAPSRTRWLVIGRMPRRWTICCRVTTTLTGRPSSRAASAARIVSLWMPSFDPNPPPTKEATSRIRSSGIRSVLAIEVRAQATTCALA
jgi:hypothetical protein